MQLVHNLSYSEKAKEMSTGNALQFQKFRKQ